MGKYISEFKNKTSIVEQYRAPKDALRGAVVHLAWYGYGSYEGSSLVIFEKDGKLYEVNGSHCSCYGLEGQWEPEETNWKALEMREFYGGYDGSGDATKLLKKLCRTYLK